jgi:hypothetical protein
MLAGRLGLRQKEVAKRPKVHVLDDRMTAAVYYDLVAHDASSRIMNGVLWPGWKDRVPSLNSGSKPGPQQRLVRFSGKKLNTDESAIFQIIPR